MPKAAADVQRLSRLRRARDELDRAYAEPLDLQALASGAGYSLFHFVRAFADVYGVTPGRYLARRRVERARELLRSANLTITEVCFRVGFSSLGSFSARFKEETGLSPSAFRAEAVRAGGPPPVPGCFILMWSETAQPGRSTRR